MKLKPHRKRSQQQACRNRTHQLERLEERRLLTADSSFAVIDGRIGSEPNAEFEISLQAGDFSTSSGIVRLDFSVDAVTPGFDTTPVQLLDSGDNPLTPIVSFDGTGGDSSFATYDLSLADYSVLEVSDNGSGDFQIEISLGGDIDGDQDVDGGDFLAWQRGFGSTSDDNDLSSFEVNYGASTSLDVLTLDAAVAPPAVDEGDDLYLTTATTTELMGATAAGASVMLDVDDDGVGDQIATVDTQGDFTVNTTLAVGPSILTLEAADTFGQRRLKDLRVTYAPTGTTRLRDSGLFASEADIPVIIPGGTGQRTIDFSVGTSLGKGESGSDDQLAIYLIDDATDETLLGRGESGSSLLEIGGDGYEYAEGLVEFDGDNVSIDVSSLPASLQARVRFQLLDFDATHVGDAVIAGIGVNTDATQAATSYDNSPRLILAPGEILDFSSFSASSDVKLLISNERFDLTTGRYESEIRLQNTGGSLGREFVAVFDSLPSGVTILNASGVDGSDNPYLNLTPAITSGGLITGGLSSRIRLEIDNTSNTPFSLAPQILSGGTNTAPVVSAISPLSVVPGEYLSLAIPFIDTESDEVELTINGPVDLPTMMIDGRGNLVVTPEPGQEGTYSFDLVAFDGALSSSRSVQLTVPVDSVTTTRLSGTILNTEGVPLVSVPIELGSLQTTTAADGTFTLETVGALPGDTLIVRGEAITGSEVYPYIAEKLPLVLHRDVFLGARNDIGRPIYLPALDVAGGTAVDPNDDTMVLQEIAPGEMAEVFVAEGTLEDGGGNAFTGVLSITEVPSELTPAALPDGSFPDTVVTIQPGEMVFTQPAPLTLPNRAGWPIGTELDLYSINPTTGEFEIVGKSKVSADGSKIETIEGGINNSSWHFLEPPPSPNAGGPDDHPPCPGCQASLNTGSEVILQTGEYREEHDLVSYQSQDTSRGFTLNYDSLRADPRPILRFSYTYVGDANRLFARATVRNGDQQYVLPGLQTNQFSDVIVSAPENGHFWEIDGQDARAALQLDLRNLPSGKYAYTLDTGIGQGQFEPGQGGGNGGPAPEPTYRFSGSTTRFSGDVYIVNDVDSPFGAGWNLVGLQRIIENRDGSVLLVDGNGQELSFTESDGIYEAPEGDFSVLEKLPSGTFRRTATDQTVYNFNDDGQLESIIDSSGNTTSYLYGINLRLEKIVDPAGLETLFSYTSDRITAITDPASRITQLDYNNNGDLIRITDPDGTYRQFEYDDAHHLITEIDKRGFREETIYGFHGRVESVTDSNGAIQTIQAIETKGLLPPDLTKNPLNAPKASDLDNVNVVTFADREGNVERVFLDSAGRQVSSVDEVQSTGTVERDENGQVIKSTSTRGLETNITYDGNGNVTTIRESGGVPDTFIFSSGQVPLSGDPYTVDTADFNNDGILDLVTIRPNEAEVDVLLGTSSGGYGTAITTEITSPHAFVKAVDIDGDNRVDIVTTEGVNSQAAAQSNARISIFKGLGNGRFETRTDFQRGQVAANENSITFFVESGDFNNDGRTDLFAHHRKGTTTVYLNQGLDGFSIIDGPDTGVDDPSYLDVADINGDGILDVATDGNGFDLKHYYGNGDGTFADALNFTSAGAIQDRKFVDVDGDGNLDVLESVLAGSFRGFVTTFGIGNGQFEDTVIRNQGGNPPSHIEALDLNDDGLKDIVMFEFGTLSNPANQFRIYYATGPRSFGTGVGQVIDGPAARDMHTADVDGDGRLDIILAGNQDEITIYRNHGDGTLNSGQAIQYLTNDFTGTTRHFAIGDVNNDGLADIVDERRHRRTLKLGNGQGGYSGNGVSVEGDGIQLFDINQDGNDDIVAGGQFTTNITTYHILVQLGNGDGTFQASTLFTVGDPTFGPVSAIEIADFDNDGHFDVAATRTLSGTPTSGHVAILSGDGAGNFALEQLIEVGARPESITTADYNNDGNLDFAAANWIGDSVSIAYGNGDVTFQAPFSFAVGQAPISIESGDIDGDGRVEIIVASQDDHAFEVYQNDGSDNFSQFIVFPLVADATPESVKLVDLNKNGLLDIVTAYTFDDSSGPAQGFVSVYFQRDTPQQFERVDVATGQREAVTLQVFDVNGDGFLDVSSFNLSPFVLPALTTLLNQGVDTSIAKFEYDPTFNVPTRIIDEIGRETRYVIDQTNGNVLQQTLIVGFPDDISSETDDVVTSYTYTTDGLIETETDALSRVTQYAYNAERRLTSITFALGTSDQASQQFEYDLAGNTTATIDENNNRTEYEYDNANRLTQITEPDPDGASPLTSPVTQFVYDAAGNLVETVDARGNSIANTYDPLNRLITTTDELGQVTKFAYDNASNLIRITDPRGQITRNEYDSRGRLTQTTDAEGGITKFKYDSEDNLIELIDPVNNVTQFRYDLRGRQTIEIDPLGQAIQYVYDDVDQLTAKIDRNGRTTEFEYDDLGDLIQERWLAADASTANTINYDYDAVGNLLTTVDAFSSLTFTYDNRDRVETVDNLGTPDVPNVVLTYGYDGVGNVTSVSDVIAGVAGATTSYAYDALNRTTTIQQSGPSVSDKLVDFAYNELGQFDEISRYSDLARTNLAVRTDYEYDQLNRLTDLDHKNALDQAIAFYDYEYDAASRITAITDIDGRTDYSYDETSQLTSADRDVGDSRGDESYDYDANGNRVDSHLHGGGYVTGSGNRLLSDGTYNYEYDEEGNMVLRTEIATGAYREFVYDHRNRLTSVTDFSVGGIITQDVEFAYDTLGRRIAKTVDLDGEGPNGETTTHFVYDGDNVLLDFVDADGSGSIEQPELVMRYLFGPGVDQILAQVDLTFGQTQWLLTDHLGTIRDIASDSGVVLNHILYDSFGNVVGHSDPLVNTRYLFTGREFDTNLSLYYFRTRYYDASVGRFLSEDSLGFAGRQYNTSAYVSNSPLLYVDSNGTVAVPIVVVAGIAGGVIGGIDSFVNGGDAKEIIKRTISGAASGAVSSIFKNAAIGGAAGGVVGDIIDQLFDNDISCFDYSRSFGQAVTGGISGGIAGKIFKPKPGTFSPKVFKPRPFDELDPFGPLKDRGANSRKIIRSVIFGSTLDETAD